MIGPERFEATGYFEHDPQVQTIEKTVGNALRRKLAEYRCQQWTSTKEDGAVAITQAVYVVPAEYMRAFVAAAEGRKPILNMKAVISRLREQGEI